LAHHFTRKEERGWLDEALARAPRFGAAVEGLLKEHDEMLTRIRELALQANRYREALGMPWRDLSEALAVILRQVHTHEARENELLQQAFNLDNEALS